MKQSASSRLPPVHQRVMDLCRRNLWIAGLVLTGVVPAMCQVTGLTTLQQLKDQARPLLVFAPKPDDPRLEIQMRTLQEHASEAHERDVVMVALPYNTPSPTAAQLSSDDALDARRRFGVAPGEFAVILLGKDGGSKLRSSKPISMQKLDDTIDAMPMRRDEMKSRGGKAR